MSVPAVPRESASIKETGHEPEIALDDALIALGWSRDYQVIDIGTLKTTDVRSAYPAPTLLWRGKDIFGMPRRSRRTARRVDGLTRAEFRL